MAAAHLDFSNDNVEDAVATPSPPDMVNPLSVPVGTRPDYGPPPADTASNVLGHEFTLVGYPYPGNADVPGPNNVPVTSLPREKLSRNATTPKFYPVRPG